MSTAETRLTRLAVVGAGSMGAGIAQLGCVAGIDTVLFDVEAGALERAGARISRSLRADVDRGRLAPAEADRAIACLSTAEKLEEIGACELIIEAVPESLELKRSMFARLSELPGRPVLATNTSSLMVAAIASAATAPERVVGMHFFNPPERMRLVEIVAGPASAPEALALADRAASALGRRTIRVQDRPGFLVNRCLRPFYSEALRLLEEGVAGHEQVDRIMRLGGGFRMGPFELLDLVGLDVNLEVTRSFFEQSCGEPRWKPSPAQARMVAAGRLGRKTDRGFYDYDGGQPRRAAEASADPAEPQREREAGTVAIRGEGAVASMLRELAGEGGWAVQDELTEAADILVDAGLRVAGGPPPAATPWLCLLAAGSLAALHEPAAVGFHLLGPRETCALVELTALASTPRGSMEAAEGFFAHLGLHREWVRDAPGLVLGRILCQIVNEACFAIGEGVASAADVDTGAILGLNHPLGPIERAERVGPDHVAATLTALWAERQEERYRMAPLLRRAVAAGEPLSAPEPAPAATTSVLGGFS